MYTHAPIHRAVASAFAAALLLSAGAPSAWALRDVLSNQPFIPDTIVPGKTLLQSSGGPSEIQSGGAFVMDYGGAKVLRGERESRRGGR